MTLIGFASFSIGDAIKKQLRIWEFDSFYILFWSAVVSICLVFGYALFKRQAKDVVRLKHPVLSLLRSLFVFVLGYLAILSFYHLEMTDAYILIMTSPIFAILLFYLFFGEPIKPYKIMSVLLGFVGAAMVIKPGVAAWDLAYLAPIGVALMFVTNNMLLKKVVHDESKLSLIFYPNLMTLIICTMLLREQIVHMIDINGMLFLLATGVCSLSGAFFMAWAVQLIEASEVSLYHYVQVFYGVALGYFFFNEHLDWFDAAGIVAIIASGLVIYFGSKRRQALEAIAETPPI